MKVTLITGASSGIGEAFARRLAAEKHDLVLVSRNDKKLHEMCDELMLKHKIFAHYVVLDLAEPDPDLKLLEEVKKHDLEVDWLINNAGFGSVGDFAKLEIDRELQMIELVRQVLRQERRDRDDPLDTASELRPRLGRSLRDLDGQLVHTICRERKMFQPQSRAVPAIADDQLHELLLVVLD